MGLDVGEVGDNEARGYVSHEALGYREVVEDHHSDLLFKEKLRRSYCNIYT